jgi:hypothetical protein
MNHKKMAVLFVAVLATAATAGAQNDSPRPKTAEFFRLDFALKEMDGSAPVRTYAYQMMIASNYGTSSIRSGAKVPVSADNKGAFTYIDVGVKLDVRQLNVTKDGLEFDIVAELSGVLTAGSAAPTAKNPMIYQTQLNSRAEIPVGKPTVIFSSDDPSSKHQLHLEVTATPIH